MERCPACPKTNNVVPSDGPERSELLFIGEGPGKDEDRTGHPFVGKTGQEVNAHYLPLAGLRRANCRFANAISCLPPGHGGKLDSGRPKDIALLESCSQFHLTRELEIKRRLIIPMGAFACRVVDRSINLDLHHGIPRMTTYGMAFPMFHPARGLHQPKTMLQLRTDWYRLKKYLAGSLQVPIDQYTETDYSEITDGWELVSRVSGVINAIEHVTQGLTFYPNVDDALGSFALETYITKLKGCLLSLDTQLIDVG